MEGRLLNQHPVIEHAIVLHRQRTEHALARLRTDDSLDDYEKGRRITEVIAAANSRMIELIRREPTEHGGAHLDERLPFDVNAPRLTSRRAQVGPRGIRWD
jgi:hypothetical protein